MRLSFDSSDPDPEMEPRNALDERRGSGGDILRPLTAEGDGGAPEGLVLGVGMIVDEGDLGGNAGGC